MTGDRGAEAATARASRILVVEDDAPTREFLVDALTTQGYSVVSVADGAEAGQRLRSSPYHLLLTDIRLPGLSGLELFRLCRAAQPYTETILVTSAPDLEAAVAAVRDGAFDYLAKPVGLAKLRERVRSALVRQRERASSDEGSTMVIERIPTTGHSVIRTLGSGNIGMVFLVEKDGELFAMKILKSLPDGNLSSKRVLRFLREAEIVSRLDNELIVKVHEYGFGPHHKFPFILMEYVDGTPLSSLIATEGLELEDKVSIIAQICRALAAVHELGVLHRDIKPGNILIAAGCRVKVTDFGIARLSHSDLTADSEVVGSPCYMAPESFEGSRAIDHRADIFSLGALSYELLTGRKPFQGAGLLATAHAIARHRPVAPRKLDPEIPEALEAVVAQMLRKVPAERYQSARDIAADIERIRRGAGPADMAGDGGSGRPAKAWR